MTYGLDLVSVLVLIVVAGLWAYDHVQEDPSPAEEARDAYRNGEISLEEVNGIGSDRARAIQERL